MYYAQYSSRQFAEPKFARGPMQGVSQLTLPRPPSALPKPGGAPPYSPTTEKQAVVSGAGSVMAHSASQSSVQGLGAPVPAGQCSPQMQLRTCVAAPLKEPVVVKAVATPLRSEEGADWSIHGVWRIGNENEQARFAGRARVLDRQTVSSVADAVDALNRRLIWCPEDFCVAFSAVERAYYLLYKNGRREIALAQLGLLEGSGTPTPIGSGAERTPSRGAAVLAVGARLRQDSRSNAGPVSSPDYGRTSYPSNNTGMPEVTRQSSLSALERPGAVPSGGASTSTAAGAAAAAAAAATAASSARRGKPPIRTATTRTPSSGLAQQPYMAGPPALPGEDPHGMLAAGYQRYASPAARVVQSYQPVAAGWAAPMVAAPHPVRSGTATPTPPPSMGACGSAEAAGRRPTPTAQAASRVVRAAPPPAAASPATVREAPPRGPSAAPPAAAVVPIAPHRLSTPRETLERDLTEPEKVKFSDLEFIESLGSGEFGQVFRGTFRGCEVAIKQLYWDDTMTELVMQDLAKEIESFRHLRHKRLVRFIGACLEMPHPCLITEYMPGGSLHHLLHVRKLHLPLLHALNMCLQVADGVMYLHAQTPTIVHRDLKSLNVVLDLSLNIKICDFGLTEPMERTHITKKNNGGSPRYMAPELFDSKTKITEKIDVWAMGCIFVEICGGPLPYENISTLADLTREMLVNRRTPDVPLFIPGEVRQVVSSCLNFDYRLRPTSKAAFELLRGAKKQLRESGAIQ